MLDALCMGILSLVVVEWQRRAQTSKLSSKYEIPKMCALCKDKSGTVIAMLPEYIKYKSMKWKMLPRAQFRQHFYNTAKIEGERNNGAHMLHRCCCWTVRCSNQQQ